MKRILVFLFVAALLFFFGFVPYTLGGIATRRRFSLPDKENTEYVNGQEEEEEDAEDGPLDRFECPERSIHGSR